MAKKKLTNEEKRLILDEIAKNNGGRIDPKTVVDVARDPAHPFHDEFTWDDEQAANEFRLIQATNLLRSVKMQVTYEEHTYRVPLYVADTSEEGSGYVHTSRLRTEQSRALDTLDDEIKRLIGNAERTHSIALVAQMPRHVEILGRVIVMLKSMGLVSVASATPESEAVGA